MEGFFYWLIIFVLIIAYTAIIIFIDRLANKQKIPEAVLSFTETDDKVMANFLVLLPMDEIRGKDYIYVEIRNEVQENDSQEKQDI